MTARRDPTLHVSDFESHGTVALVAVIWAHRRWLAVAVAAATLAAVAFWLWAPSTFRAEATFVPSAKLMGDDDAAQLGALRSAALSLGVSVGGGKADPALLFPEVLKSHHVLRRALVARLPNARGDTVPVLQALRIRGRDEAARVFNGERRLRNKIVRSSVDVRTGMTRITVNAPDARLAAGLANFFVAEIDSFSRAVKSRQAGRQVQFVTDRLADVQRELAAAEETLRQFRVRNRLLASSPELALEQARLERDVQLNEQLYLTIRSQLEIARIEEAKTIPMLVSIDAATPPPFRESPRLGRTLIAFVALALVLAAGAALAADARRHGLRGPASD